MWDSFVRGFGVVLLVCVATVTWAAPPNIVMILTDDQGWGDLSVHGNTNLATPRIDSLAKDGAMFSRFYVQPVCAPTRAEMLTGRYHPRTGVRGVSRGEERMNTDESTLAEMLNAAGYATGMFGKWHNGTQDQYHPNARGFDEFYGFTHGHWGTYFDTPMDHNGEEVRGKGFIIDDLTNHGLDFIEDNKGQPFFCYLAYNTPHSPFQVPDKFYAKFDGVDPKMKHRDPEKEEIDKTRAALAMVENIDWNVGRVLEKLAELDLEEDTIVIYFSDNGPNSWRWNNDMRGKKGTVDEGGVRVPCFIKWPGKIAGQTQIETIAGAIDFLPTLAEMTGTKPLGTKPIDGRSLVPLLQGTDAQWDERYIFSFQNTGTISARDQNFILDQGKRLYDLKADPGQRKNVNMEHPEIAEKMTAAVKAIHESVAIGVADGPRPFSVGRGPTSFTDLPARDGIESGEIQRSNRAPNCSFFTHWTRTEDVITWNVDVGKAGLYEAVVYYTCPEDAVGSKIALTLGDAQVAATVDEAHDSPLYGEEHDRADRGTESFMKDFRPMTLGRIQLAEGKGTLRLSALEIPGSQAIDVYRIVLHQIAE